MWRQIEDRMDRAIAKVAASDCSDYETLHRQVSEKVRSIEQDLVNLARESKYYSSLEDYLSVAKGKYIPSDMAIDTPRDIYHLPSLFQRYIPALLECKEIPPRSQSRIQKLYKAATSTRRIKGYLQWYVKIREGLKWALTSDRWPDLSETQSEVQVGSITVINQTDLDPSVSVDLIKKATKAIRSSGVPGFEKALYGNVFLVTSISGKRNMMAWYYPKADKVYLILSKRFQQERERSLIHEFGHRFWERFADDQRKKMWIQYHNAFDGKVELSVGDTIPTTDYVITDIKSYRYSVSSPTKGSGYIEARRMREIQRKLAFPTQYAATNYEEHFCEALSLYALGKLKSPHIEVFERIWL